MLFPCTTVYGLPSHLSPRYLPFSSTAAVTYRIISLLRRSARPPSGDVQPDCARSDPYPRWEFEKRVGSDRIQISIKFFTFFRSEGIVQHILNVLPRPLPLRNFVPFAALPIFPAISSGISRLRFRKRLEFPRVSLIFDSRLPFLHDNNLFNYQRS